MAWVKIRKLCLFVSFALFVWSDLGESYAVVVGLNSVRDPAYYECDVDRKLDWQVIRALESDRCRFHSGLWFNGKVEMDFVGDKEALNQQIAGLHECPAKRVSVCFKPLRQDGTHGIDCAQLYWKVNHDPRKGVFEFLIDANSTTLCREDISVPAPDRPPMDQTDQMDQ